jgi:hypothetical protein
LLLVVCLAAATLVNPYGFALPYSWYETLAMPLPSLIVEHAPLDPFDLVGMGVLLLVVGYVVLLIGVLRSRPRITWLVPLAWFVLTLGRIRHAPLLAVTAALALADMLPYSRVGRWLERRELLSSPLKLGDAAGLSPKPRLPLVDRLSIAIAAIAVVVAIGIQVAGIRLPVVGRDWARFDPASWPVGLLPQIEEINRSSADGTPIFNDMNFGGFLIYHAPRLRVFIDDRCPLYGTEFFTAYDNARRENPAELDRWQRQYGFHYALVETDGQFDHHLAGDGAWTRLGRSPAATLYWRR